eukprot:scaffold19251_cov101-Isochrysis_galbana.AAC.1
MGLGANDHPFMWFNKYMTTAMREELVANLSESALSGGTAPVWPWRGAQCLAPFVPGASCSQASVSSIGGSVMIALHV